MTNDSMIDIDDNVSDVSKKYKKTLNSIISDAK